MWQIEIYRPVSDFKVHTVFATNKIDSYTVQARTIHIAIDIAMRINKKNGEEIINFHINRIK
jgi:hypothetical protein